MFYFFVENLIANIQGTVYKFSPYLFIYYPASATSIIEFIKLAAILFCR